MSLGAKDPNSTRKHAEHGSIKLWGYYWGHHAKTKNIFIFIISDLKDNFGFGMGTKTFCFAEYI